MEIVRRNIGSGTKEPEFFADKPGLWAALEQHIHQKSYKKDDALMHHGSEASQLWLVLNGWIKLTRQTPDGKETIVGLCHQGDFFGEAALFVNANYPCNAEVISESAELGTISASVMRDLMKKDPALSSTVMQMFGERASQAQLKLEHMSTMSTAQRLGCFLLRICGHRASNQASIQIPVEKYLVASFLGMKPETLSRSQAQLKPVGVEVHGTQVIISDIEKLREFVCNSCSESGACDSED